LREKCDEHFNAVFTSKQLYDLGTELQALAMQGENKSMEDGN
jgi:hypothetical protein